MITGATIGSNADKCVTDHPEIVPEITTRTKYFASWTALFPLPWNTTFLFSVKLIRHEQALAMYVASIIFAPHAWAIIKIM